MNTKTQRSQRTGDGRGRRAEVGGRIVAGILCVLCVSVFAFGCATRVPDGYDADLTPGHNGEAWVAGRGLTQSREAANPDPSLRALAALRDSAAVRRAMAAHLEREPFCAWCGVATGLNVHHVWPVAMRPDLAATEANLITLCRECHWVVGHCRNWRRAVTNVREICNLQLVAGSTEAPR